MRSESHSRIASDTSLDQERRGAGRPGLAPSPHPPGRPRLTGSHSQNIYRGSGARYLCIHFSHRHVRDIVMILEEGNHPYPRCPQCDMFVPQKSLSGQHFATSFCIWGMERKWHRLVEEEAREEDGEGTHFLHSPILPGHLLEVSGKIS